MVNLAKFYLRAAIRLFRINASSTDTKQIVYKFSVEREVDEMFSHILFPGRLGITDTKFVPIFSRLYVQQEYKKIIDWKDKALFLVSTFCVVPVIFLNSIRHLLNCYSIHRI